MRTNLSKLKYIVLCIVILYLSACASKLEPVNLPEEVAIKPSQTNIWHKLDSIRNDNWYYLLNEGRSALEWRLRAIDSAMESIDFQTFLWSPDTSGTYVLNHILAAADRGVRVRILMDDTFLLGEMDISPALQSHKNIEYRIFNPYKRRTSSFTTRELLNLGEFHRLNHRMHNKVMIVDNRISIIGGRNIADEYFGLHENNNFRDMELLAGGDVVQTISKGFDLYWNNHWSFPIEYLVTSSNTNYEHENKLQVEDEQNRDELWISTTENALSGKPYLLLDDPPSKNPAEWQPTKLADEIIQLIDSAKNEILIISAYLIPTKEFEGAIERAKKRGVKVSILTNSIRSTNHITAHSAYRNHVLKLLKRGADLHEVRVDASSRNTYMQAPVENKNLALHAKAMIVDKEKVFIGSANFDPRSLRLNSETGLIVHSKDLGQQVFNAVKLDFHPENAWQLQLTESGNIKWVSADKELNHQPAHSFMQQIEDWFFALLPIEGEM